MVSRVTAPDLDKCRHMKNEDLMNKCKIPFRFYVCKDTNKLKWCDLTGPEKHRLFKNIDLPQRFPSIPNIEKIMDIWTNFHRLNSQLSSDSFTSGEISVFEEDMKSWRSKFLEVYQSKHVTPYMHAFVAHVPGIHGAIVPYTQQGLEKLNDSLTQFYYLGSNHRETEALTQMLQ